MKSLEWCIELVRHFFLSILNSQLSTFTQATSPNPQYKKNHGWNPNEHVPVAALPIWLDPHEVPRYEEIFPSNNSTTNSASAAQARATEGKAQSRMILDCSHALLFFLCDYIEL